MRFISIIVICVLASIAYGIVHDLITARICVEYFTIGHPPVFNTEDPTLLGLGWGILATWWVGLLLGLALACAARIGSWPKRSPASLVRVIATLMIATGTAAAIAGCVGWMLARNGALTLIPELAARVPPEKHDLYLAVLWTHLASYGFGILGGAILIVRVWRTRPSLQ